MERLAIEFVSEDIQPFQIHPDFVPDALLPRVWFMSDTSQRHTQVMHRQQWVFQNEVKPDTTYKVRIKNIGTRKIKNMMYYTYEINYYHEGISKARIKSSFVEVIKS